MDPISLGLYHEEFVLTQVPTLNPINPFRLIDPIYGTLEPLKQPLKEQEPLRGQGLGNCQPD